MTGSDHSQLVADFVQELWNDPDMGWVADPAHVDALVHPEYRPGYWRTLHWSAPWAVQRTALEWLELQVAPYRFEYPDFALEIRSTLAGGDEGQHVVADLDFQGHHASRTFTNRGGTEVPEARSAHGVSWSLIRDDCVARHALLWDGGTFLGRAE